MDFSLSFFSSMDDDLATDKYRFILETSKYADEHGYSALWFPERHFQPFGGLFPNPSVLGGALAAVTKNVKLRTGSVVCALHHPVRLVEEWAMVDNLSGGRVELSFATGWHVEDYIFNPNGYTDRKENMYKMIEECRELWRGGTHTGRNGAGTMSEVRVYPKPIQPELPIYVTLARDPNTYVRAGEKGYGILTHLMSQSMEELEAGINSYYEALERNGHDRSKARITVLVHTFIWPDLAEAKEITRIPFSGYLSSSASLLKTFAQGVGRQKDVQRVTPALLKELTSHLHERYFGTITMMGTADSVTPLVERLRDMGATELGCLIDFGVDLDTVMKSMPYLDELRRRFA